MVLESIVRVAVPGPLTVTIPVIRYSGSCQVVSLAMVIVPMFVSASAVPGDSIALTNTTSNSPNEALLFIVHLRCARRIGRTLEATPHLEMVPAISYCAGDMTWCSQAS